MVFVVMTYGYSSFSPWSVENFFIYYTMVIVAPILFVFWKLIHKTKFVRSAEMDLVWEAPIVDRYEKMLVGDSVGFWTEMTQLVGFRRNAGKHRDSVVEEG